MPPCARPPSSVSSGTPLSSLHGRGWEAAGGVLEGRCRQGQAGRRKQATRAAAEARSFARRRGSALTCDGAALAAALDLVGGVPAGAAALAVDVLRVLRCLPHFEAARAAAGQAVGAAGRPGNCCFQGAPRLSQRAAQVHARREPGGRQALVVLAPLQRVHGRCLGECGAAQAARQERHHVLARRRRRPMVCTGAVGGWGFRGRCRHGRRRRHSCTRAVPWPAQACPGAAQQRPASFALPSL